ncbi:MAG: hypothetical protein WC877_00335 [Dehalococcoidales bacterium]
MTDVDIITAMELYEKSIQQFHVMAKAVANDDEFRKSNPTVQTLIKFKGAIRDLYNELDFQIAVTSKFIEMAPNVSDLLWKRIDETIIIGKTLQEKTGIEWEALPQWTK